WRCWAVKATTVLESLGRLSRERQTGAILMASGRVPNTTMTLRGDFLAVVISSKLPSRWQEIWRIRIISASAHRPRAPLHEPSSPWTLSGDEDGPCPVP